MSEGSWFDILAWAGVVVVGYPLLTLVISEIERRAEASEFGRPLRVIQNWVLPAVALWILIHKLSSFPSDGFAIRLIDTAVGIFVLYAVLLLGQILLLALRGRTESQAPKLFYELAAVAIAIVGGTFIVSFVWDVDLATLFGALGVGSVVLGLALQNVIGGLANGLIVLSGRNFAIGDWLQRDDGFARVSQVDWRAVTLEADGQQVVVPTSELAGSALKIVRNGSPFPSQISIMIPSSHRPQQVVSALLDVARRVPESTGPDSAFCQIEEWTAGGIRYSVGVMVDAPGKIGSARSALIDRMWHVLPRHGISIMRTGSGGAVAVMETPVDWGNTAEERLRLIVSSGAFRGPVTGLEELAEESRIERYSAGETLQEQNTPATLFHIVLEGALSMSVALPAGQRSIGRLLPGQIFAIREALRNSRSPVSLTADEPSTVVSIPAEAMQRLLDRNHKLGSDVDAIIDSHAAMIEALKNPPSDDDGPMHANARTTRAKAS